MEMRIQTADSVRKDMSITGCFKSVHVLVRCKYLALDKL